MSRPGRTRLVAASAALALGAAACQEAVARRDVGFWSPEERALIATFGPTPEAPPPSPSNRWADDEAAAELGHALFFEPRLSGDGTISCATCHDPAHAFSDAKPRSEGIGAVRRNAPTVLGSAWMPFLNWDGRKDTLWSQALGPIEGPEEMGSHRLAAVRVLRDNHRARYEAAFGPFPAEAAAVLDAVPAGEEAARWDGLEDTQRAAVDRVFSHLGKAIAAYERKLAPGESAFDRFREALAHGEAFGGEHLSPAAKRGLRSFLGEAGCVHCHNGPLFSDLSFHNIGLPPAEADAFDLGRAEGVALLLDDEFRSDGVHSDGAGNDLLRFLDPGYVDLQGAFKTPTLRNVARTAPYGHAGQFATLEELLEFYRDHRGVAHVGHLDPVLDLVRPTFSVEDMAAFLHSLDGAPPDPRWTTAPGP